MTHRFNGLAEERLQCVCSSHGFDLQKIEKKNTKIISDLYQIETIFRSIGLEWDIVSVSDFDSRNLNLQPLLGRRLVFYENEKEKKKYYATYPFYTTDYGIHSVRRRLKNVELRLTLGDEKKREIVSKENSWLVEKVLVERLSDRVRLIVILTTDFGRKIVLSSVDEADTKLKFVSNTIEKKRNAYLLSLARPSYVKNLPLPRLIKKKIFKKHYKTNKPILEKK